MRQVKLPAPNTPLYNHPLPDIEQWLESKGCEQDAQEPNLWHLEQPNWHADLRLDIEELTVLYTEVNPGGQNIRRTFKYSLSRQDIEDAVFSGP